MVMNSREPSVFLSKANHESLQQNAMINIQYSLQVEVGRRHREGAIGCGDHRARGVDVLGNVDLAAGLGLYRLEITRTLGQYIVTAFENEKTYSRRKLSILPHWGLDAESLFRCWISVSSSNREETHSTDRLEHSVCGDLESEAKGDDSGDHRLGEHGWKVEGGG
jgi:hypothetical protein